MLSVTQPKGLIQVPIKNSLKQKLTLKVRVKAGKARQSVGGEYGVLTYGHLYLVHLQIFNDRTV